MSSSQNLSKLFQAAAAGLVLIVLTVEVAKSNCKVGPQLRSLSVGQQKFDKRARYLAFSGTNYSQLTLLQNINSTFVTAGPGAGYNSYKPPPSRALQGYFDTIYDNIFAPGNLGIRRVDQRWALGVVRVGRAHCLHARLEAPYLFLGDCENGTLTSREMTWINWHQREEADGEGGFIEPYGNQIASDFVNGDSPSFQKSWGFLDNHVWRTEGMPIKMSKTPDPKAHLTILRYEKNGPDVTNCYEECF